MYYCTRQFQGSQAVRGCVTHVLAFFLPVFQGEQFPSVTFQRGRLKCTIFWVDVALSLLDLAQYFGTSILQLHRFELRMAQK